MLIQAYQLKKFEFEYRIFISFSFAILTIFLSYVVMSDSRSITEIAGTAAGADERSSRLIGYFIVVFILTAASVIRMWAGSILTSRRMMLFKVQPEKLITEGPYGFVRNPIYLADFIAMCGFVFILPKTGLLLPLLFYIHYNNLIRYEEENLLNALGQDYRIYMQRVPRFFPELKHFNQIINGLKNIRINHDGFRHNALYLLFIPGLLCSALMDNVFYLFLIGIPAVVDWGFVHTHIGLDKKSKVFENVLYAQCWEDPELDRQAFNISKDDVVFSITSGGCNTLTFLLDDPKKVIALDLNPYQNYLLELKISAFKEQDHKSVLEFFGVYPSEDRVKMFGKIKHLLSHEANNYWNNNIDKIEKGIIHSGRYENYMKLLRRVLNVVQGKRLLHGAFENESIREKQEFYDNRWNNLRWRIFTHIFLSRKVMSLLFDKAFFRYLKEDLSFGKHFSDKVKYAITELPLKENYFLSYILLGHYYDEKHLPPYLIKGNYEIIKSRLDRIEIITGDCLKFFESLPDSCITKFNFTNIFEWIPEESFEKILKETIRVGSNMAIMTYRNLLVHREHFASPDNNICSLRQLSLDLQKKDLSFIYDRYVAEQIVKED